MATSPATCRHRDAEEQPDRFHLRLLRHLHGFRADLAHLVDRGAGRAGRIRDLRRLRLAGQDRGHHSGRRRRAHRSRQPKRTRRGARATGDDAMSAFDATAPFPARPEREDRPQTARHAAGELMSKRIIVGYGFWIFLLSDIIMFSAFFATYAVLVGQTAGGPSGRSCSTCAIPRSRRPACCCRASPAASPASARRRGADPGSMAPWR